MTSVYVTSGSAMERADQCPSSLALPHADFDSDDAERGRMGHRLLEEIPESGFAAALAALPDADPPRPADYWRAMFEHLDLTGVSDLLKVPGGAEIAIAVNVSTWTARELGRGAGRAYHDVTEDEIPTTLDVVRVLGRRGMNLDWKFGFKSTLHEWQLRFGALAMSILYDLDHVTCQQVNMGRGRPWIRRVEIDRFDLAGIQEDVAAVHKRALARRAEYKAGKPISEFKVGEHCTYCPAKRFCPAQTQLLRRVIAGDELDDLLRISPMDPRTAAQARDRIKAAEQMLQLMKSQIAAAASGPDGPLYLGQTADGRHRWYGQVVGEGDEKFDGTIVEQAMVDMFPDDPVVAIAAIKKTATKKALEAAIRSAVPKGKGAHYIREAHEAIRAAGGATRKPTVRLEEFTTIEGGRPPRPQLPEFIDTDSKETDR